MLPDVSISVDDNALGLASPNANNIPLFLGVSNKGTINTVYSFADIGSLHDTLGEGPLVEAAALAIAVSGGTVLCVKVDGTGGTFGDVTHVGTGTADLNVSGSSPDAYSVIAKIVTAGANLAAATAQFQYSLDGGRTYSPVIAMPVSGIYLIPATALTLTWNDGTFVVADTYAFDADAPTFDDTDVADAFNAFLAGTDEAFLAHIVGSTGVVADDATRFAALDVLLTAAAADKQFMRGIIEASDDTDANLKTAFANAASTRIMVAADTEQQTSPISGRRYTRSAAWGVTARAAAVRPSEDLGKVKTGALPGVVSINRDERVTPGLDAARFTTLRTIRKRPGFYITNGRLMAPSGSDFQYLQYGRVMDIAEGATNSSLLDLLNGTVRVDSVGSIVEQDARSIEAKVRRKILDSLLGDISDADVVVTRDNNILSTQELIVTIRIRPLGYMKFITARIGFSNPALQLQAA